MATENKKITLDLQRIIANIINASVFIVAIYFLVIGVIHYVTVQMELDNKTTISSLISKGVGKIVDEHGNVILGKYNQETANIIFEGMPQWQNIEFQFASFDGINQGIILFHPVKNGSKQLNIKIPDDLRKISHFLIKYGFSDSIEQNPEGGQVNLSIASDRKTYFFESVAQHIAHELKHKNIDIQAPEDVEELIVKVATDRTNIDFNSFYVEIWFN